MKKRTGDIRKFGNMWGNAGKRKKIVVNKLTDTFKAFQKLVLHVLSKDWLFFFYCFKTSRLFRISSVNFKIRRSTLCGTVPH